eukprot:364175-Chlamydomonas_euryale.AAC.7
MQCMHMNTPSPALRLSNYGPGLTLWCARARAALKTAGDRRKERVAARRRAACGGPDSAAEEGAAEGCREGRAGWRSGPSGAL